MNGRLVEAMQVSIIFKGTGSKTQQLVVKAQIREYQ